MSIESFTSAYPADGTFTHEVSKRPEYGQESPVNVMARIYLKEGALGLSGGRDRIASVMSGEFDIHRVREVSRSLELNTYGIIVGASILSIEEIIKDQIFDQITFNSRMENAFVGSGIRPDIIDQPEIEPVDPKKVAQIIRAATSDRTFGSFFKEDFGVLPVSLQDFLIQTRFHAAIDRILPGFITRTSLLISARNAARSNPPESA
jgi:hypothetical protein